MEEEKRREERRNKYFLTQSFAEVSAEERRGVFGRF
jgi:hypothetical protein